MSDLKKIEIYPIGFVKRVSNDEDVKDRSLLSEIVLKKGLTKSLNGIEEWSHVYIIFWMHAVAGTERVLLHHPSQERIDSSPVGIFATRTSVRPNPIGLTLVELVKRKKNILWVRGLDAANNTPILDIKPYPDWERGRWLVVADFRVPEWLAKINR
ncbi:MAG: tRNA (N6-threonylcarbamoyladenosine(37)-N6)-methyltransferase TrmO [Candidatus Odinarchaeota archaeon]